MPHWNYKKLAQIGQQTMYFPYNVTSCPPPFFLAAKLLYSFRYFVQMNVRPIYFEENAIFSAITARCSKFLVEISNFEEYLLYNLLCLSYICHVL